MSDIVFDRMLLDFLEKKNDQSNRIAALEAEIARLRGDAEVARLRLAAAQGEIDLLRGHRKNRIEQIAADMPRWKKISCLDKKLRDRGPAMKCVPMFAVTAMSDAADEIIRLRAQIARLRIASEVDESEKEE